MEDLKKEKPKHRVVSF